MPQLNIRVPQDLLDRIRSQASRERVTVSELVRRAFSANSGDQVSGLIALQLRMRVAALEGERTITSPYPNGLDASSLSLGPPPSKPGSRLKSPKVKK